MNYFLLVEATINGKPLSQQPVAAAGVILLFSICGVGLLLYAILATKRFNKIQKSDEWTKVDAELFDISVSTSNMSEEEYQGIYKYYANGKEYKYCSSKCYRVREGVKQLLTIWYNNANPKKVVVKNRFWHVVAFIVGCVCIAFAFGSTMSLI